MSPLGFSWGRKGTRSQRKPRTYPPKRTWGTRKPRTQTAAQVASLSRKVSALTKVAVNRIQYGLNFNHNAATVAGTADYLSQPLIKFNDWTRIFGTDADDEVNKQCVIRSAVIPWGFQTNEPDNRDYALFCVSLKDNASELLNNDGTLAALTQGTHYHSSASNTLLNLNFFNIHYHKRFTAGVYPMNKSAVSSAGAVQNIPTNGIDTQRLGYIKLRFGKNGMQVKNPSGDWRAGVYPKDPSKNYFVLTFFSGDSTADLESGTFYYRQLVQVDVSG